MLRNPQNHKIKTDPRDRTNLVDLNQQNLKDQLQLILKRLLLQEVLILLHRAHQELIIKLHPLEDRAETGEAYRARKIINCFSFHINQQPDFNRAVFFL